MHRPPHALPIVAAFAVLVASCAGADAGPTSPWTLGVLDVTHQRSTVPTLRAVSTQREDDFDRVIFDFGESPVPGYHLEYIDRPVRQCGSGRPVMLPGDAWLQIRFSPAVAHTDAGQPTIRDRDRRDLPLANGLRLEQTCDFEGYVTWVLALRSPTPYRIRRTADPGQLILEVRADEDDLPDTD